MSLVAAGDGEGIEGAPVLYVIFQVRRGGGSHAVQDPSIPPLPQNVIFFKKIGIY